MIRINRRSFQRQKRRNTYNNERYRRTNTQEELGATIKKKKQGKATTPDNIPVEVMVPLGDLSI